jgi:hypothetical protein
VLTQLLGNDRAGLLISQPIDAAADVAFQRICQVKVGAAEMPQHQRALASRENDTKVYRIILLSLDVATDLDSYRGRDLEDIAVVSTSLGLKMLRRATLRNPR